MYKGQTRSGRVYVSALDQQQRARYTGDRRHAQTVQVQAAWMANHRAAPGVVYEEFEAEFMRIVEIEAAKKMIEDGL